MTDPTLPERLEAHSDLLVSITGWPNENRYKAGELLSEAAAALRQLEQERNEEQSGRNSAEANGVILRADNANLTARITELEGALLASPKGVTSRAIQELDDELTYADAALDASSEPKECPIRPMTDNEKAWVERATIRLHPNRKAK